MEREPYLPPRRRWTRLEFERAGELGLFSREERLELIEGEIVPKMTPQKSEHSGSICAVEEALRVAFGTGHHVRVQCPLALNDANEPEPDLVVVHGSARDYMKQHPKTALLVVEVADTTLRFDRTTKAGLYAQAQIPEYWIVNLSDRMVEVHSDPGPMAEQPLGHAYRNVRRYTEQETVPPLAVPEARTAVATFLP